MVPTHEGRAKETEMIVGVIGSGSIGPDLAYGFLSALAREKNSKVYLLDIKQEALDAGVERIRGYAKKGVARGKLSPKVAAILEEALTPTMDMKDLADCEYVLEAASEELGIKRAILGQLESVVSDSCLIGFATSGLPRKIIAAEAKKPERCFVNHPFFPAWRSQPIEVVSSGDAALEERMMATMRHLGKVPLMTADVPCFAADDIFCNYISEAARIVEEGIANPAQVDKIVNDAIGGGGPFNVMDATQGNLLTVHCQQLMEEADTGSPWFKAPAILSKQGNTPWHDRKSPYDASHDEALAKTVLDRILAVLVGRTYFVLENDICEAADLNWMTRMALGFSKGLLEMTEDLGADRALALCNQFAAKHKGFPVPQSIQDKALAKVRYRVKVERDGDIGTVRVWRPEVMNALSADTIAEIDSAMTELGADDAIKGIVFTSDNGSLAGADIMELAALKSPEQCRDICMKVHPIMQRIASMSKPVVAALRGPVLGGGAEFAMACHARVIGKDLVLGQPEVNLGIIPGYGGTQRLPRIIGFERAFALLRTGASIGAAEACEWGWAHGEATSDPEAAAVDLIRKHLSGSVKLAAVNPEPMAVPAELPTIDIGHRSLAIDAIFVDVIRKGLASNLDDALAIEADGFARCKATVDMNIGMTNFMQNGPRVPAVFLNE
jgi:enoyl-CoA hydratase/3-hydroxyacyl-CoA dehydrogenase